MRQRRKDDRKCIPKCISEEKEKIKGKNVESRRHYFMGVDDWRDDVFHFSVSRYNRVTLFH